MVTYTLARLLPSAATFLFTMLAVQYLGATEYGEYSLGVLPATVAASFAGALTSQPILRFGASFDYWSKRLALGYMPIITSICLIPITWWYQRSIGLINNTSLIALCLIPLMASLDVRRNYFISMSQPSFVFKIDAIRSLISVAGFYLILMLGWNNSTVPVIALCCGIFISLTIVTTKVDIDGSVGKIRINRRHFLYGTWIAFWMILIGAFPYMERIILQQRYDLEVAGSYAAISDPISAVSSATGAIIISALMPRFVAAWDLNQDSIVKKLIFYSIVGIICVQVLCLLLGVILVYQRWGRLAVLLGDHSDVAIVLLMASCVWQITVISHKRLELRAYTFRMLFSLSAAMIFFLFTAQPLVDQFGMIGVAFSKLFSGFVYMIFIELFSWRSKVLE